VRKLHDSRLRSHRVRRGRTVVAQEAVQVELLAEPGGRRPASPVRAAEFPRPVFNSKETCGLGLNKTSQQLRLRFQLTLIIDKTTS
jgi:hypothetical protein